MQQRRSGSLGRARLPAFRLRGLHDVSRIESFSDAVFGFSVTLLVVSLQVPRTFDQLLQTLAGFPAFALTFALLALIWWIQNRFFRRYALQDGTTIALNIALLFVIVFFTYPLKFLFGVALSDTTGADVIRDTQIVGMFAVYGIGYAAVFAIFVLLHAHALNKRVELALTPFEVFETRRVMLFLTYQIVVAGISVATAAYFGARQQYRLASTFGGMSYLLIPVGVALIAFILRRKRMRFALPPPAQA